MATLKDPDGPPLAENDTPNFPIVLTDLSERIQNGTTTWQWARCGTSDVSTCTDIQATTTVTSNTRIYTPGPDDVGKHLLVTAKYFDGESAEQKSAPQMTAFEVLEKEYINRPPMFSDEEDQTDGSQITLRVEENDDAQIGSSVGTPIQADDPGPGRIQEKLTYSLTGGTDEALFDIDSTNGQLLLGTQSNGTPTSLDFEDNNNTDDEYTVIITATDPSDLSTTTTVTIEITGKDENPVITEGTEQDTYNEIIGSSPGRPVDTYVATDEDEDDADGSLRWSLSGIDADDFEIDEVSGALTFESPPDFENATGGGRSNKKVYSVTVAVADDAGNTDSRDVTVTLKNVEEVGEVVITTHPQPEAGQPVRASLTDPDGVNTGAGVTFVWVVGSTTTRQELRSSTASIIPPVNEIQSSNEDLRLTVTYTDSCDTGCEGRAVQDSATLDPISSVQPRNLSDGPPTFADSVATTTTLAEGSTGNVTEIRATEGGGGDTTFTYTLGGSDARSFRVDPNSGEITVAPNTVLNYESSKRTYSVTITAKDPSGDTGTHRLTITLTPVEEAPTIESGPDSVDYDENKTTDVAKYTAADDEDDFQSPKIPLSWSLGGDDRAQFTIQAGVLRFNSTPDYENPSDVGPDNVYAVIIQVDDSDGTSVTATLPVVVTVMNVDETGTVNFSATQPKEETALTATLMDPDGPPVATDGEPGFPITGPDLDLSEYATELATTTWQWARCSSRSSSSCRDIDATATSTSKDRTYTPSLDDVGDYLGVTATYSDGHGNSKSQTAISEFVVLEREYVNRAPMFPDDNDQEDDSQITMEVMENNKAEVGDPVGDPVVAEDLGQGRVQERLTYSLTGRGEDDSLFTISPSSGQVLLGTDSNGDPTSLDFEDTAITNNNYIVEVEATDPSDLSTTTTVTIQIVEVEEAPTFTVEEEVDYAEVDQSGEPNEAEVGTYTAADEDADDSVEDLKWSLSGNDGDKFDVCLSTDTDCDEQPPIGETVQLKFKSSPDFESPSDSGGDNMYNVNIEVTDGESTSTKAVVVSVQDLNEEGEVSFSNIQPEDGTPITASLSDPDVEVTSSITWQWSYGNSNGDNDPFTEVAGATFATYTPTTPNAEDGADGQYLRATAKYTDGQGANKTAFGTSSNRVQPRDSTNEPPEFPDVDPNTPGVQKDPTRYVKENQANALVVSGSNGEESSVNPNPDLVIATDDEPATSTRRSTSDKLTYTLSGADSALFTIDTDENVTVQTPGQIRLAEGVELDFEDKGGNSYTVMVTAIDPTLASDTITVTIKVVDMDEEPVIEKVAQLRVSGDASPMFDENQTGNVATYRATVPDGSTPTWSKSGADSGVFTLSGGVLSIDSALDYEPHSDANRDNVYEVTVTATAGGMSRSLDVEVPLVNVDEPGTVTISPDQPSYRVGDVLSASLSEGDDETVTGWQWARSTTASGTFTSIGGATSDTYTIVEADVANYLQVTVTYDQPAPLDSGLDESAVTGAAVLADTGTDGTVSLSPSSGLVSGDSVTAILTDPDNPTNHVWRWERSADGSTNWTTISGETSASYTTTAADAGHYLRATVTYDDDSGAGLTLDASTSSAVKLHRYDDDANGEIERDEVINAINDYLIRRLITRDEVIKVIKLYLGV